MSGLTCIFHCLDCPASPVRSGGRDGTLGHGCEGKVVSVRVFVFCVRLFVSCHEFWGISVDCSARVLPAVVFLLCFVSLPGLVETGCGRRERTVSPREDRGQEKDVCGVSVLWPVWLEGVSGGQGQSPSRPPRQYGLARRHLGARCRRPELRGQASVPDGTCRRTLWARPSAFYRLRRRCGHA